MFGWTCNHRLAEWPRDLCRTTRMHRLGRRVARTADTAAECDKATERVFGQQPLVVYYPHRDRHHCCCGGGRRRPHPHHPTRTSDDGCCVDRGGCGGEKVLVCSRARSGPPSTWNGAISHRFRGGSSCFNHSIAATEICMGMVKQSYGYTALYTHALYKQLYYRHYCCRH